MLNKLVSWVSRGLGSQCAVCHAWPAQPVCADCLAGFGACVARCPTCALPVVEGVVQCGACVLSPPPLDGVLAALPYAYPWAGLIANFKFGQQTGWAPFFAARMREVPGAAAVLEQADGVLPLPLSRERLCERGYNQSQLLAQALAPGKVDAATLVRVLHSAPQHTLPREQRLRNVQRAFALGVAGRQRVQGRHWVLVDDVMTSGASVHAAAGVLLEAGARRVSALVLARTADDHGGT